MHRWHSSISHQCVHTGTYAAVKMMPIAGSPLEENDQSSAARTLSISRPYRAISSMEGCDREPPAEGVTRSRKNSAWRRAACSASPDLASFSSAYTRIVSSRRQRLEGVDPSNVTSDLATRFAMPSTTVDPAELASPATAVAASNVNPAAKTAR